MLKNAFKWIKDRFQERSTKQNLILLIGFLTAFGVIEPDTQERIVTGINEGQAIYHEGRDSVAATIDRGVDLYEEGKDLATDTRDTGLYFWFRIMALFGAGMALVGATSKDAKSGIEYDTREKLMKQKAEAFNVDISL